MQEILKKEKALDGGSSNALKVALDQVYDVGPGWLFKLLYAGIDRPPSETEIRIRPFRVLFLRRLPGLSGLHLSAVSRSAHDLAVQLISEIREKIIV